MINQLKISSFVWVGGIAAAWVYLINPEGRIFPAAAEMKLTRHIGTVAESASQYRESYANTTGPNTAFWLRSARLRDECSFVRVEWHMGRRDGQSVPVRIALGPPKLRPGGVFVAGPWIANVKPVQFTSTYGDVLHRCSYFGWPAPWLTRTRFWN